MNEENYTCEICFENYDLKNPDKLPKKVPCCNKTFCLKCLNDIYERNSKSLRCPNCRKVTMTPPKYYKDNILISSRYLICCNCHGKVPQNELYFCQNNNEITIKCEKCENDDMKLSDILPEVITETNKNLKEYENIINTSIIELTKKEIKKDIEEYFQNIMKNLIESITNKVITEFNDFWQIEKRENEFKNMVNELNKNNKYLNDYIEDIPTKNFDSKIIFNCIKYYNNNISKIKNEFKFLEKFRDLIINNRLIGINRNFDIKKLEECFLILIKKNKNDKIIQKKNEEENNNSDNNNNNNINNNEENNNNNSNQNFENIFINDKMILELDKLIIQPKFEYSLSAQRV